MNTSVTQSPNRRLAIGVDIGATRTKLVLIREDGKVLRRSRFPTLQEGASEMVTALIQGVQAFRASAHAGGLETCGIGFTVPCYHEEENWLLHNVTNLPFLEKVAIKPALTQAFGENIALINDNSAAGIAEHLFGGGQGEERLLVVVIGTGISSSFITREQGLVRYFYDTNGDTGHIIVDPIGKALCTCGGHGCLEAYTAAPALRQRALDAITSGVDTSLYYGYANNGRLECSDITRAAHMGDTLAANILRDAGRSLGVALVSMLHIFCPSRVLIGGGVSQAGELLIAPARQVVQDLSGRFYLERLHGIQSASLGIDAGAIGSASLILFPGKYIP